MTTPGHTANHMAYAFKENNVLFSGDHVMAWSTPVVAPPDGSMGDYMASLQKLAKRTEPIYFPGHGPAVSNAPRFVAAYILHRKAREASILNRLQRARATSRRWCSAIYANLDPRLLKAAGMSVLAHLEDLVARGAVATNGPPSIAGRYRWPERRRLWPPAAAWRPWRASAASSAAATAAVPRARPSRRSAVRRSSMSSSRLRMRAALVPKSWRP